uniref:Trichohyalin n=1 Tax=Heterorhabditis bacteriophora TaxID=37862 RepID=A0A1I7XV62_HETBA
MRTPLLLYSGVFLVVQNLAENSIYNGTTENHEQLGVNNSVRPNSVTVFNEKKDNEHLENSSLPNTDLKFENKIGEEKYTKEKISREEIHQRKDKHKRRAEKIRRKKEKDRQRQLEDRMERERVLQKGKQRLNKKIQSERNEELEKKRQEMLRVRQKELRKSLEEQKRKRTEEIRKEQERQKEIIENTQNNEKNDEEEIRILERKIQQLKEEQQRKIKELMVEEEQKILTEHIKHNNTDRKRLIEEKQRQTELNEQIISTEQVKQGNIIQSNEELRQKLKKQEIELIRKNAEEEWIAETNRKQGELDKQKHIEIQEQNKKQESIQKKEQKVLKQIEADEIHQRRENEHVKGNDERNQAFEQEKLQMEELNEKGKDIEEKKDLKGEQKEQKKNEEQVKVIKNFGKKEGIEEDLYGKEKHMIEERYRDVEKNQDQKKHEEKVEIKLIKEEMDAEKLAGKMKNSNETRLTRRKARIEKLKKQQESTVTTVKVEEIQKKRENKGRQMKKNEDGEEQGGKQNDELLSAAAAFQAKRIMQALKYREHLAKEREKLEADLKNMEKNGFDDEIEIEVKRVKKTKKMKRKRKKKNRKNHVHIDGIKISHNDKVGENVDLKVRAFLYFTYVDASESFLGGWTDISSENNTAQAIIPQNSPTAYSAQSLLLNADTPSNEYLKAYYEQYYKEWYRNHNQAMATTTSSPQETLVQQSRQIMTESVQVEPGKTKNEKENVADTRSANQINLTKTQLDHMCLDIKQTTKAFGITDAKKFASNNCMMIQMYYRQVTCEQIIHVVEYCEPVLKQ